MAQQTQEEERVKKHAIVQLLHANGILEEDAQNPERVTQIEMVLDDYCCMGALKYFPNLRSVVLIQQAICNIEGLECCIFLERLLLNENRIKIVEGLQACTRLRNLYLCTNLIEEFGDGLKGLDQLEVLWIAENQLSHLGGLGHAANLKEFNGARNKFMTIVQGFDKNANLTSINVADNRICSFKDILDLARLPALRELSFTDPDWGENPICFLCNYQTYTLFQLPALQVHDRMRITEQEHQAATMAFSKKRLYYNMRIKTVKRIAADGLRWARGLDDERLSVQTQELESVAKTLKRMDASNFVKKRNLPGGQPPELDPAAFQNRTSAEWHFSEWQSELADASCIFNALHDEVIAEKTALIQGLELELQTGGNIRMEPGTPDRDYWVRNVEELVKARFDAQDLARFGISDIKVCTVTRVHNRSLRIRMEELVESNESERLQQTEYLFYAPDPLQTRADIRCAIEEGPGRDRRKTHSKDQASAVVLTNSVTLIEAPRIEVACASEPGQAIARATQRAAKRIQESHGNDDHPNTFMPVPPIVCGGALLVCSAQIGDAQAHTPQNFDVGALSTAGVRALWPQDMLRGASSPPLSPSLTRGDTVTSAPSVDEEAPTAPDVCRQSAKFMTRIDDPKQKAWLFPEADLVLPEFLVEFDYVFASSVTRSQMPEKKEEHGPMAGLFRDFALHAKLSAPEPRDQDAPDSSCVQGGLPELQQVERVDVAHLPALRKLVCSNTDKSAFTSMLVLNLHCRGIRRIEPTVLLEMKQLKMLLLAFNFLESASNLPRLPSIEHIDISFNIIEKLDTLVGLPGLCELDLSWNSLLSFESLQTLARDVPQLESLHLLGNPISKGTAGPRCRVRALARMKCLRIFDGKEVPPSEVLQAQQSDLQPMELTEGMLMEHAFSSLACMGRMERQIARKSAAPPAIDWDSSRNRISNLIGRHGDTPRPVTRSNWKSFVECLDLRKLGLTDLCEIRGFNQVRRLLLSSNELSSLSRFCDCTSLEELSLENNELRSLRGASALVNLQRLDAGSNQLEEVLDLQKLTKLSQLSLEDNYIDSLDTFSTLRGLMELYLSNNLIEELRAVLMLKPLPKLVVLDLTGNGLCTAKDYRFYTIFHLKKLKVLDGSGVSQAEQQEAEDRFSGRLTMELLEDKLGPVPACYNLRSVDLSGLNLRDLGNLLNDDIFPSLRELTVEGNPFSDLRTVGPLSKLLVLRMNKSKIDLEKMLGDGDQGTGLGTLPHLQVLEMGDSGIADISYFEKLPLQSLRILHLPSNELTKVDGLSNLEQLRELVIDHNKVKQFDESSFRGLRCLRELRAEDNGLKNLANLGPLPRLRALYLSQNRVAELSELEKLSTLKHVMLINLQQNPVARKPLYRAHLIQHVSTVRVIDGREVSEDERDKSEQLLQSVDPSKPMGMYVFTENQSANQCSQLGGIYMTSAAEPVSRPMGPNGPQDKGSDSNALKKHVAGSVGNTSGAAQQSTSSIMMMGQAFVDAGPDDRRGQSRDFRR